MKILCHVRYNQAYYNMQTPPATRTARYIIGRGSRPLESEINGYTLQ